MTDFQSKILLVVLFVVCNMIWYYAGKKHGEALNIKRESKQYVLGFFRGVELTLSKTKQQNRARQEDESEE